MSPENISKSAEGLIASWSIWAALQIAVIIMLPH